MTEPFDKLRAGRLRESAPCSEHCRTTVTTRKRGLLVIVSGPSGSGKTTITRRVVEDLSLVLSISATTRKPRPGETDGRDYYFLSKDEFRRRIAAGEFLEYARVHGRFYGTPKRPVEEALSRGKTCVLEIDVQGARQVIEEHPEALTIFVVPPDADALRARLLTRSTDELPEIEKRLEVARKEMSEKQWFTFTVLNDDLEEAVRNVKEIISTGEERARCL